MALAPSDDRSRNIVRYSLAGAVGGLLGSFPELAIEDAVYGSFGKTGGALCTGGSLGAAIALSIAFVLAQSNRSLVRMVLAGFLAGGVGKKIGGQVWEVVVPALFPGGAVQVYNTLGMAPFFLVSNGVWMAVLTAGILLASKSAEERFPPLAPRLLLAAIGGSLMGGADGLFLGERAITIPLTDIRSSGTGYGLWDKVPSWAHALR